MRIDRCVYDVRKHSHIRVILQFNGTKHTMCFEYRTRTREEAIRLAIAYRDKHHDVLIEQRGKAHGNEAWHALSEFPRPRPTSQLLLWQRK